MPPEEPRKPCPEAGTAETINAIRTGKKNLATGFIVPPNDNGIIGSKMGPSQCALNFHFIEIFIPGDSNKLAIFEKVDRWMTKDRTNPASISPAD
jgi:hypothetical protein